MAALARLGARQVPLLPIYKERELRFCLEQSQATFMLHPGTWRGTDFTAAVRNSGVLDAGTLTLVECDHALPQGDPATLPPAPAPEDGEKLRWVFYTSGTTADPKGVQHCDRSVMAGGYPQGDRQRFRPGDRYGLAFPFTHIGGATNLAAVLICGFQLVLAEAFEPDGDDRVLPPPRRHRRRVAAPRSTWRSSTSNASTATRRSSRTCASCRVAPRPCRRTCTPRCARCSAARESRTATG